MILGKWFFASFAVVLCSCAKPGAAAQARVYLAKGEIWAVGKNAETRQLTHDGVQKSSPILSPDRKEVAYYTEGTAFNKVRSQVFVLRLDGAQISVITPTDPQNGTPLLSVLDVQWLGTQRIGIECSVSPSTNEYLIADVSTGKITARYFGFSFQPSPDGKWLAHVGWMPHFSPPQAQSYYLQLNDLSVYPMKHQVRQVLQPHWSEAIHTFVTSLSWAPDSSRLAFVDHVEPPGEFLLVLVNPEGGAVTRELSISQQTEIDVRWLDPGLVEVSNGAKHWTARSPGWELIAGSASGKAE